MGFLFALLFCITLSSSAQNTMALAEGSKSPKATLEAVSWVAGHWKGEAIGDSMMFVFKLASEGKLQFYEVGHIQQTVETLILQKKHFHGSLKG